MSKKIVKKAVHAAAHQAADAALHSIVPVKPLKKGTGDVWKCLSFLLIGLIGGYLLSPNKGGVLIGSFNGWNGKLPEKKEPLPHIHHGHKQRSKRSPFAGSVVIASFNRFRTEEAGERVEKEE